jgi:hypothetical protein
VFRGEAKFEKQLLFEGDRHPNVVVATDGTVLATLGSHGGEKRASGSAAARTAARPGASRSRRPIPAGRAAG